MSDDLIQKKIFIHAPVEAVWDAITNPAIMPKWMSDTKIEIHSSMTVGGSFSIHGNMENHYYASKGAVLFFEKFKRFGYNYWNDISRTEDIPENYSIIDFKLEQKSDGTELIFSQHQFIGEATAEHARFYWNSALAVLKKMVEELIIP